VGDLGRIYAFFSFYLIPFALTKEGKLSFHSLFQNELTYETRGCHSDVMKRHKNCREKKVFLRRTAFCRAADARGKRTVVYCGACGAIREKEMLEGFLILKI
jgi:hypothetical protein